MNEKEKMWYENSPDNKCRYILGTKGQNPLICIGINPSTAEPENWDRTINTVNARANSNRYDSWIMLNVYPQRATNPEDIHTEIDTKIVDENLRHIKSVLEKYQNIDIWAAWGENINKRPFLMDCLKSLYELTKAYNCKWVKFGDLLKAGHPHHPLYQNTELEKETFDIENYLNA